MWKRLDRLALFIFLACVVGFGAKHAGDQPAAVAQVADRSAPGERSAVVATYWVPLDAPYQPAAMGNSYAYGRFRVTALCPVLKNNACATKAPRVLFDCEGRYAVMPEDPMVSVAQRVKLIEPGSVYEHVSKVMCSIRPQ
jgi:hypothetical protein